MQRLDETPIEGPDTTEERKKQDRAGEILWLEIGRPFRPYQLFDRVSVIPNLLRSYRGLTAGEKIAWMTLASFLGKEGGCYPSGATLGREMGVDRKQARRWVDGLVQKRSVRKIPRPPERDSDDWSTNLYELPWHEVFQGEGCVGGDRLPHKRIIIIKRNSLKRITLLKRMELPVVNRNESLLDQ